MTMYNSGDLVRVTEFENTWLHRAVGTVVESFSDEETGVCFVSFDGFGLVALFDGELEFA